eukprot:tig00021440_g21534.t1
MLPCAVSRILDRTGASSLNGSLEAHPRPTFEDLRSCSGKACICVTCAINLVAAAAAAPAPAPVFKCPACGEDHRAPDELLSSSRIDAYLAYASFIEDGNNPQAWIASEIIGRQALASVFEHVAHLALEAARAKETPRSRSRALPRPPGPGRPPGLDVDVGAGAGVDGPSGPSEGNPAPAPPGPGTAAGAGSSSKKGKEPALHAQAPAAAPASPPAEGDRESEAKGEAGAGAGASARAGPGLRKRPDREGQVPSGATQAGTPQEGGPSRAKRQRSKWGSGRTERKPYESDKLVKVLYTAYTYPAELDRDADGPEDGAGAPAEGSSSRSGSGSELGDPAPASEFSGCRGRRRRLRFRIREISESDAGSRAGSPDPRDAELAEAWSKAYAAAVRLDSEASSERDGGEAAGGDELESAGSASQEGQEEDPESLPPTKRGWPWAWTSPSSAAASTRIRRPGRLCSNAFRTWGGREFGRSSSSPPRRPMGRVRGAGLAREQSKIVGYWRKEHIETKYNSILEAVGFRLELPAQRTEIYTDLKNLAETMRRFPGLCRVSGSGISPIDFLSTVPLLKTADAEGAKRVAARVSDEVRRAKGYAFDESVLELGALQPAARRGGRRVILGGGG